MRACDVAIRVPSTDVARIQEIHIALGHVLCELVDTPGTVSIVEPPQALDISEWLQELSNSSGSEYSGASTLPLQTQLTTTEATTLAIVCAPIEGSKEAKVIAVGSQLSALQTTANK